MKLTGGLGLFLAAGLVVGVGGYASTANARHHEPGVFAYFGEGVPALETVELRPGLEVSASPWDWYFNDALSGLGEWVLLGGYGYVWKPWVVADWAPYSVGYWASDGPGMLWVSYEPFGSITDHYGNWGYTDAYGWVWFPGDQWVGANVTWLDGADYIGWYPIPPAVSFVIVEPSVLWEHSVWVPRARLLDQNIALVRERNFKSLWHGQAPAAVVHTLPRLAPAEVQRWTGQPLPIVKTEQVKRQTRNGEVTVVVPDATTRDKVRQQGPQIAKAWLSPKAKPAKAAAVPGPKSAPGQKPEPKTERKPAPKAEPPAPRIEHLPPPPVERGHKPRR